MAAAPYLWTALVWLADYCKCRRANAQAQWPSKWEEAEARGMPMAETNNPLR